MHFEFIDDGIDKAKALTMVVILGLGAAACSNGDPGNGNKVRDCKYSVAPTDIAVTADTNAPDYDPATDPRVLLRYKKSMAKGAGMRDNSSEDVYNSDELNQLGEIECFTDPNNPERSLVLSEDGRRLSEACSEDDSPGYIDNPTPWLCPPPR